MSRIRASLAQVAVMISIGTEVSAAPTAMLPRDVRRSDNKVQMRPKSGLKASVGAKPVAKVPAMRVLRKDPGEIKDGQSEEEEEGDAGLSFGGEVDLNTRYLWRGIAFSTGPVLQPAAWLSWRGWTSAIGANVMLSGETPHPLTVLVPTVAYSLEQGAFSLNSEAMLVLDVSGMEDNPTAMTLGIEGTWSHDYFEVGSHHYLNVVTDPGAYYGELAAGLNGEAGPWLLTFALQLGLGSPSFRNLYLDDIPGMMGVLDGSLRVQYSWPNTFYISAHAEHYTLLNQMIAADVPRFLTNVGLTLGAES